MCFVLFLASRRAPPHILWSEERRALWTQFPSEEEAPVRCQFTLPCLTYLGSDLHCGCGFRNAMFQGGCWPEEWQANEPGYDPKETQANHEGLVAYVRAHFSEEPFVELYGCWWGEFKEPARDRQEILLGQLADASFFFRHRGYYRVRLEG